MRLYHLSSDVWGESLTRTFSPRVPLCGMRGEDREIPRVCFSKSILGCVNAIPNSHLFSDWHRQGWDCSDRDLVWDSGWNPELYGNAVLYSIDTEDLAPGSFMDSLELYERGLVPDALATQECWCLEPIQMTGEIVDIRILSNRKDAALFSTKERNRDCVFSLIDRLCDGFATKHKDMLNELSLFYIINDYLTRPDLFSREVIDRLEDSFSWLSTSSNFIDKYSVFSHCEINGVRIGLEEHLDFAWKRPRKDIVSGELGSACLDELMFDALVEEAVRRAGNSDRLGKELDPGPEWAI